MRERPILFNGAMVRAILDGRKTQTRRVVKPVRGYEHDNVCRPDLAADPWDVWWHGEYETVGVMQACPFGQPGDRLWVRESFADLQGTGIEHRPDPRGPMQRYAYAADTPPGSAGDCQRIDYGIKWRPSIHMPRWACRLVLEITDVRVERLQALPDADWEPEGICFCMEDPDTAAGRAFNEAEHYAIAGVGMRGTPEDHGMRAQFAEQGLDWDSNPWVWVIGFRRVEVGHG